MKHDHIFDYLYNKSTSNVAPIHKALSPEETNSFWKWMNRKRQINSLIEIEIFISQHTNAALFSSLDATLRNPRTILIAYCVSFNVRSWAIMYAISVKCFSVKPSSPGSVLFGLLTIGYSNGLKSKSLIFSPYPCTAKVSSSNWKQKEWFGIHNEMLRSRKFLEAHNAFDIIGARIVRELAYNFRINFRCFFTEVWHSQQTFANFLNIILIIDICQSIYACL